MSNLSGLGRSLKIQWNVQRQSVARHVDLRACKDADDRNALCLLSLQFSLIALIELVP